MTDYSGFTCSIVNSESQAVSRQQDSYRDCGADADADYKQRRKLQNRRNQRARRLRIKEHDSVSVRKPRLFTVTRWRLNELEDTEGEATAPTSFGPSHAQVRKDLAESATIANGRPQSHRKALLTPPMIVFPLSTDHLLHLVQYNVFRAFLYNKQTLNVLLTGWTSAPPSATTCPISGPYRDDTSVFPLNPNIPAALVPTPFQQAHPHPIWINFIPFPRIRDNLIRCQGQFDHWDFLQDLIGELMGANQFPQRQGVPLSISVTDPEPQDGDALTKDRKGLIVWGEPHVMQSWEATPLFLAKWAWAVKGCNEILDISNRWRMIRGEDPIHIFDLD